MSDQPLTIIIFGATGNLYSHKLSSALFLLFEQKLLPSEFNIIAFARRPFDSETFRNATRESILARMPDIDPEIMDSFLSHVTYFQGDPSNSSDFLSFNNFLQEKDMQYGVATNRLMHLATPPYLYEQIFTNIAQSGIVGHGAWARVLIEKPFGKDTTDAVHLNKILSSSFKENQIFHIDHYLAKETVRSIFDQRFVTGEFESEWDSQNIEKIKIVFHESNIVGSRGAFYDGVGAFRDVGQNHMLELLALVAMDDPGALDDVSIRGARANILSHTSLLDTPIVRGQYEGYRDDDGVAKDSTTETFFRLNLAVNNSRWQGTIFELEAGKGLVDMHSDITTTSVYIEAYFKDGRVVKFAIQPVPGTVYDSYTTVYLDAIEGNQTVFVSNGELMSEWKIADEVLKAYEHTPLVVYAKGSEPEEIQ